MYKKIKNFFDLILYIKKLPIMFIYCQKIKLRIYRQNNKVVYNL
jgi:hypothetical protein